MPSMRGVVTIAQETRFQLVDDEGIAHLFVLGPMAGAEPDDLARLQAEQARVRVRYARTRNLIAHRAERLERI
ncbi:hypothetical protein M446_5828 [Methylobacterium sp. 4-46]|uniref:hypothetical protein n=1 Tax=unclassified Methylobacterium TaxID=2615210 RepID=UPI000165CD9B|nr:MULTISPECIES: hypothetical protein [Methylobacterium]ACA20115.1 hypothetical protein M446_5828 [Methylobacterium sp. 4-46]WFT79297.1 hypothetical protein QA634_29415 [Methylobacterium nodulans]